MFGLDLADPGPTNYWKSQMLTLQLLVVFLIFAVSTGSLQQPKKLKTRTIKLAQPDKLRVTCQDTLESMRDLLMAHTSLVEDKRLSQQELQSTVMAQKVDFDVDPIRALSIHHQISALRAAVMIRSGSLDMCMQSHTGQHLLVETAQMLRHIQNVLHRLSDDVIHTLARSLVVLYNSQLQHAFKMGVRDDLQERLDQFRACMHQLQEDIRY
jgi:hypothetical protein